ncbi:MAG TPA: trypsin-like peptidase domain-containing protein [Candidatus Acidoferrum sp.]|nr:trypsin-like peptidase domain-containing protein [Candidatus Acidoferrum sp.]
MLRNNWRPRKLLRALLILSVSCVIAASVGANPARAQAAEASGDTLHKLNESVDNLIKKVSPSVVQILVTGYGPLEESDRASTSVIIGRQRAIGSGFVIDAGGYIVTNAHVVNGAQLVRVVLPVGSNENSVSDALSTRSNVVPARVVGVARDIDLALLKVDGVKLNALPVAAYRSLRQGEIVFAFGSPEGLRNTVTMGVISAVARQTDLDSPMVYVQTDAPINPGNSGGPLVNVNGEVVGVNTFILSQSGGNEGLGFAIPSSVVNVAYKQLRQFGHLHKTEIGIGVQTITPTLAAALNLPRAYGVIISDVKPNTPAIAAGLLIGDVLLSVDGRPAENLPFVGLQFLSRDTGDKVHLEVLRGKDRLAFDVKVMEPPHDMDQIAALADPQKSLVPALGILGVEIDEKIAGMAPDLRDPFGILVAARAAGASIEVPLVTGDVIRTLNGVPMTTLDRLRSTLKSMPPGSAVALQIQRDDRLLYIGFTTEGQ